MHFVPLSLTNDVSQYCTEDLAGLVRADTASTTPSVIMGRKRGYIGV